MRIKKIISCLIVFAPVLGIYQISVFPVGTAEMTLAAIVLVLVCMNIRHRKKLGKYYFVAYYAFFFIVSLMSILVRNQVEMEDFIQKWIRIMIMVYIIDIAAKEQFDRTTLYKWSVRLGVFFSAILIVQSVAVTFFSIQIEPYIVSDLFTFGEESVLELISIHKNWLTAGIWRPSSIFLEPAQFAQFVLLSLVVSIFEPDDLWLEKKALCSSIIITMALFFSGSANGILITVVVWGVYFARYLKSDMKVRQFIFICIIFCTAAVVVLCTDYLENAWERVETTGASGGTTGNIRFLQGLAIFSKLPIVAKLFGIGFGNIEPFLLENNITTVYLSDLGNQYMNGFSTVLVSSGIIGFCFVGLAFSLKIAQW